jgi:hypothetical protein
VHFTQFQLAIRKLHYNIGWEDRIIAIIAILRIGLFVTFIRFE